MPACEKTGSCHCLLCALSTFRSHITLRYRLHKRGVYSVLGGETKSLLAPNVVKLSHNGTSDAQGSVYLWVGVAIGLYIVNPTGCKTPTLPYSPLARATKFKNQTPPEFRTINAASRTVCLGIFCYYACMCSHIYRNTIGLRGSEEIVFYELKLQLRILLWCRHLRRTMSAFSNQSASESLDGSTGEVLLTM